MMSTQAFDWHRRASHVDPRIIRESPIFCLSGTICRTWQNYLEIEINLRYCET